MGGWCCKKASAAEWTGCCPCPKRKSRRGRRESTTACPGAEECESLVDGTVELELYSEEDPSTEETQEMRKWRFPGSAPRRRVRFSAIGQLRKVPREQRDDTWPERRDRRWNTAAGRAHVFITLAERGGYFLDSSKPPDPTGLPRYTYLAPCPRKRRPLLGPVLDDTEDGIELPTRNPDAPSSLSIGTYPTQLSPSAAATAATRAHHPHIRAHRRRPADATDSTTQRADRDPTTLTNLNSTQAPSTAPNSAATPPLPVA